MFRRIRKELEFIGGLALQATTPSRIGNFLSDSGNQARALQENQINRIHDDLCAILIEEFENCKSGALRSYFEQRLLARGLSSCGGSFPPLSPSMEDKNLEESRAILLDELWKLASPHYYIVPGYFTGTDHSTTEDLIFPFDWAAALREVAAKLPFEGVTEADFVAHLRRRFPELPLTNLTAWLCEHFPDLLLVTRSAVTSGPLYYHRWHNNLFIPEGHVESPVDIKDMAPHGSEGISGTASALCNALNLLNQGKELPIWTDLADIAALLPTKLIPCQDGWSDFLGQPGVRDLFEIESSVMVRWPTRSSRRSLVLTIVDSTSLSMKEQESLVRGILPIDIDGMGSLKFKKTLPEVAYYEVKIIQNRHKPSPIATSLAYAEKIIMDDFLEPEHLICELISIAKEESPGCIVHVMCSAAHLPIISSLRDILSGADVTVYFHTPLDQYCVISTREAEFRIPLPKVGNEVRE